MNAFEVIAQQLVIFGAGLGLLLAVSSLARSGKQGWLLACVGLCICSISLRLVVYARPEMHDQAWAMLLYPTSMLLIGPLILRLGHILTDTSDQNFALHLVVPGFGLLVEGYIQTLPTEMKSSYMQASLRNFSFDIINVVFALGAISLAAYLGYLLGLLQKLKSEFELKRTSAIWLILLVPLVGLVLMSIAFLGKFDILFHVGAMFVPLAVVLIFVYSARYPNLFENLKDDIQYQRYKTTVMSGLDVGDVSSRLEHIFGEDRIYRDENLRLQSVADCLHVNRHQLSRILNERYKKNFNEFVNEYRIEEAKDLIVNSEETILRIAYRVGFNTRATFNVQFQAITGMTPLEYRERGRKS